VDETKEEGRRKKEEGRRKKEEGKREKEEGRRKRVVGEKLKPKTSSFLTSKTSPILKDKT
jgi:hypothetical protein